jgi:hypothetical protein
MGFSRVDGKSPTGIEKDKKPRYRHPSWRNGDNMKRQAYGADFQYFRKTEEPTSFHGSYGSGKSGVLLREFARKYGSIGNDYQS